MLTGLSKRDVRRYREKRKGYTCARVEKETYSQQEAGYQEWTHEMNLKVTEGLFGDWFRLPPLTHSPTLLLEFRHSKHDF